MGTGPRSPTPSSEHSRFVREEQVTSTGWRIVGKAISLVNEAVADVGVQPGRDEDVLYAASFRMRPRLGGGSAVNAALVALSAAVARDWTDAPPLAPDRPLRRAPGRFHGLRWDTLGEPGSWTGELVWRHPHPVVAGVACTTHVVLAEQHGHTVLTVLVAANGGLAAVRGLVGAGQARPAFLSDMARTLRLAFDGGPAEPRPLTDETIDDFVDDVLFSETRDHPVAVLAPQETGGYLVPPETVADELLGLAHLYVMDRHPTTFRLSDALGDKRLSCYWGALRAYMPDFSCADPGHEHPLLLRDRVVDPVIRAELVGTLGRFAARRVGAPTGVAELRQRAEPVLADVAPPRAPEPPIVATSTPAPVPTTSPPVQPVADLTPVIASMQPLLGALGAQIGVLAATIERLVQANASLGDEIARLRTTTAVRAVSTTSLERRVAGFEELIQRHFAPDESQSPDPDGERAEERIDESREDADAPSLVDVLRNAAGTHTDSLLLLDSAERSAAESPFVDVDRLAVILDAMASVARRRQEGNLGTSLRAAFRELGIDYRGGISAGTSERHRQQYLVSGIDGRVFECHEHIVLGSSYDPRYCLRIYFTSRAPAEPRFVIGFVGRHFDVATTT